MDSLLAPRETDFPFLLTAVYLIRFISTIGLAVAHQVGLDAVAAATHKVCDFRTTHRLYNI